MHAFLFAQQLPALARTVSSNQSTYNAFTDCGSPAYACAVTITINSGVIIGGGAGTPFRTGSWPAGSTFLLVNYGRIEGRGGDGNSAGGDAILLGIATTIDNTDAGLILAGGGGGATGPNYYGFCGGGGGGGGQGNPGGAGSTGGHVGMWGSDGGNGSRTSNGGGGAGGQSAGVYAGDGGNGGTWGGGGMPSGANSQGDHNETQGAGGKAVNRAGNALSWLRGYNGAQVKGAVV